MIMPAYKKEILGIPVLNIRIGVANPEVKQKEGLLLKKRHRIGRASLS